MNSQGQIQEKQITSKKNAVVAEKKIDNAKRERESSVECEILDSPRKKCKTNHQNCSKNKTPTKPNNSVMQRNNLNNAINNSEGSDKENVDCFDSILIDDLFNDFFEDVAADDEKNIPSTQSKTETENRETKSNNADNITQKVKQHNQKSNSNAELKTGNNVNNKDEHNLNPNGDKIDSKKIESQSDVTSTQKQHNLNPNGDEIVSKKIESQSNLTSTQKQYNLNPNGDEIVSKKIESQSNLTSTQKQHNLNPNGDEIVSKKIESQSNLTSTQKQHNLNPNGDEIDSKKIESQSNVTSKEKQHNLKNDTADYFDDDFDDFDFDEAFDIDENKLDFQEFRLCKVIDVRQERKFTKLQVVDAVEKLSATILCSGFWQELNIQKDDVISAKAKKEADCWVVDNANGFIVTQPHTLISGTSVVSANYCLRRGVLQELFRGFGCLPNVPEEESVMTIGCLVHEVLQKVLRKKVSSKQEVEDIIAEILESRRGVQMMYDANLSLRDCKQKVEIYVPQMVNFVKRYIKGTAEQNRDGNFQGKIENIREIEENIWLPEMGLKGKIDVTVDVKINFCRKIMPLEVKTGRTTFSSEHRGQLMLYSMMLGFLGEKIHSGLLLYIKENAMQEIKNNHPEERDLVMLRNTFAYYMSKVPEIERIKKEDGNVEILWRSIDLPEPINDQRPCAKCAYNTLCCVLADRDGILESLEARTLRDIHKETMEYLKPEHVEYIVKWITMLRLENATNTEATPLKNIWMLKPRVREAKGDCLYNLKVVGKIVELGDKYVHTFARKDEKLDYPVKDMTVTNFLDSDYIIVSTDTRINVSAGFVRSKSKNQIELLLDRNIVAQNPTATFHLDKYPSGGTLGSSLAAVASLLCNNEITNKLREIIIDGKPTSFDESLPRSVGEIGSSILFRLNRYQRKAILSVLAAKDYLLIKGMPGTGKTQTLVALIELLVKIDQTVLVTSHTNSAVDNILLKLKERNVDFLRLGSFSRIDPELVEYSEQVVTAECKTPESLDALYRSKKVVAITCYGAACHGMLSKRIFDVCLIDESTQVLQTSILNPIYSASKFILVGDPDQLPPVIKNEDARKMGMNESLFARLDNENNTVILKLQYRMNRKIMSVANDLTYNGNLKMGNNEVATATLGIKDTMVLESCERWVSRALSMDLEDSVIMLNTGATHNLTTPCNFANANYNEEEKRSRNIFEAAIILRLITVLLKGGLDPKSIGVICPFRAQVELLRRLSSDVEISTVDQYQGRDKDVVIYSCTKSRAPYFDKVREFEILQDSQRLNVAITRAKHKLILVGDKSSLNCFTPFNDLFKVIREDIFDLEPGRDDFSWDQLIKSLKFNSV